MLYNKETIIEIPTGNIFAGSLPQAKINLIAAWIEIHQEDQMADWQLALNGEQVFKIEPLR